MTKLVWDNEHEYHDATKANDWAILKLTLPLILNSNVQPACLPSTDWKPENSNILKEKCFTSGWGRLYFGS